MQNLLTPPATHRGTRFTYSTADIADKTKELPPEHRNELLWLADHARDRDLTVKEVATAIGYDPTTLYKAWFGPRNGTLNRLVGSVTKLRKEVEGTRRKSEFPFVITSQTKKIWVYCDTVQSYGRIGFVWGLTQVGKSRTLVEYARRRNADRPKSVTCVEMPHGGDFSHFLAKWSDAMGYSTGDRAPATKRNLFKAFNSDQMVIIHEVQRAFRGERPKVNTVEFIKEFYNETGTPVILDGTHEAEEGIETADAKLKRIFDQLRMRGFHKLVLDRLATQRDLARFAAQVGLEPAQEGTPERRLQDTIVSDQALGFWLMHLEAAKKHATSQGRDAATWADVRHADKVFRALSNMKTEVEE